MELSNNAIFNWSRSFPGGFYQDEFASTGKSTYGVGCKLCPLGHYMYHNMLPQERRQQIVSYVHKASEIKKWLYD